MSSHRFADWEAAPGWVVQRAGGQHGDEDVEQAVHDATYRARMTMPAGAQTFVVRATDRIMAGGGLAPMVRRLAQPRIARACRPGCGARSDEGWVPRRSAHAARGNLGPPTAARRRRASWRRRLSRRPPRTGGSARHDAPDSPPGVPAAPRSAWRTPPAADGSTAGAAGAPPSDAARPGPSLARPAARARAAWRGPRRCRHAGCDDG